MCVAQVNDLLFISYLVLERGVWSLPSPPIKPIRRSWDVICLSFWPVSVASDTGSFVGFGSSGCREGTRNVNSACVLTLYSLLCLSLC